MATSIVGAGSFQLKVHVFTAVFGSYFLLQLVLSHMSHSLTLLLDAYHTLYNLMALVSYIIAIKMSGENTLKNTFGWARIEVLSVMVSILALGAFCFSTAVEAVQTMVHASHLDAMHHPVFVLGVGVTGVVLNVICFLFIGGFSYSQSFLHVSRQEVQVSVTVPQSVQSGASFLSSHSPGADVDDQPVGANRWKICHDLCRGISCSVVVIVCSLIVHMTSDGQVALYIDPALSLVAAVLLMATSYSFVKESGMILLQTVPADMDIGGLKDRLMKQFPSINNVHDLHVWRLTKDKVIATAHVMFDSPKAYAQIAEPVSAFFKHEGISQTTIQPEFLKKSSSVSLSTLCSGAQCVLKCGMAECEPRTCCNETPTAQEVQGKGDDAPSEGTSSELGAENVQQLESPETGICHEAIGQDSDLPSNT